MFPVIIAKLNMYVRMQVFRGGSEVEMAVALEHSVVYTSYHCYYYFKSYYCCYYHSLSVRTR